MSGKCPDLDLDTAPLSSVVTRSPLLRVPFLCVTRGCVSLTAEAQGRPGQMPPHLGIRQRCLIPILFMRMPKSSFTVQYVSFASR